MEFNNKIDVIIPVYNTSPIFLIRSLGSVLSQNIIKDIEVTIIDDCSTEDYTNILNLFQPLMTIHYKKSRLRYSPTNWFREY